MGVVYYGTYLTYFEAGRVEALRQVGFTYAELVRQGFHSPVLEAHVAYRLPAHYDDVLLIDTHAVQVGQARFRFDYRVLRGSDGALMADGYTVHACVDAHTLRPVRLPAWLREGLARLREFHD